MATNTAALKVFAQQTRLKLLSQVRTKLDFVLTQDTAELRGYESEIANLNYQIEHKGKDMVIEEVAYTWFNRVMALRFMDANGYTTPMVVTPAAGQMRPEILQEAMGGSVDEDLRITPDDLLQPEAKLYKRLLVASCNYWGGSMPFLFERILDYTELLLPDNLLSEQSFVSDIRRAMTDEDCQNVEIMGWLYQFYITDRKADAETKKSKKGGLKSDEQAAATQLFTPHWVVRYMVENSLGRIWKTIHPDSALIKEMPYYIPIPEGQTDTIPEDIKSVTDIKFIDPCMGSGHVLVYAFDLFCKMYEEEGYQTREIPSLILTNNIYGIDIDHRCYQLASFALTMKARAYHSRYLRRTVLPNVIALKAIDRNVIESTGAWSAKSNMWQFENVDTIGSLLLIKPEECARIRVEEGLFGRAQQLLKTQAEFLSAKYHCVVTNPPYLGKGFCDVLKSYIQTNYPNSKADTMATFMERCLDFAPVNGKVSMINMQSWMFLSSYEELRKVILKKYSIDSLLHLGPHAFDEIGGEVVQCATFTIANHKPTDNGGIYYRLVDGKNSSEKEYTFLRRDYGFYGISQSNFEKIPGSPIGYWISEKIMDAFDCQKYIGTYAECKSGLSSGDNPRFMRQWYEPSYPKIAFNCHSQEEYLSSDRKYVPITNGGGFRRWYGNLESIIDWSLRDSMHRPGYTKMHLYYIPGICWNAISSGKLSCRYYGEGMLFEHAIASLFSRSNIKETFFLGYINSIVLQSILKIMNPTLNNGAEVISSIPFFIPNNEKQKLFIQDLVNSNISTSKSDWDAHETSWDFQANELIRLANSSYQLLADVMESYKAVWTANFLKLHANEEELNRQFIEIYGLQEELTPDVPLEEVTILQKGEISIEDGEIVWHEDIVIKQLISYLVGCYMGRYSIDKPGLIIASQHQDLTTLDVKVEGVENGAEGRIEIDDDGMVPILAGEYFPDDMTVRIEQAIKLIFGEEHFQANLRYIDEKLGKPLREYLFKDFFNDHIDGKMYQKRPIYWMFSSKMGDKRKKGYFKALVYMHRIESDTLSKLHADYVVPYISKIEQQHIEAEDLSLRDDLSQAQRNRARKSAEEYADQIRELKEFEQVLVQMASQRLSIDLDDGVRVNYPKFYPLVEPIKGLDKSDE